ncbi:MAG TPA: diguanylate cyclase [Dokdonella sp.]|nr:diguanylate cyclase [Dokdonella sp.]
MRYKPSVHRMSHGLVLAATLLMALAAPHAALAQQVRLAAEGISGVGPSPASGAPSAQALADPTGPLGRYALLLDEVPGQPLTLEQARARLATGDFVRSSVDIPNLGNRSPPRWLHLQLDNTQSTPRDYRIYVAEGWTDRVDAWLLNAQGQYLHWQGGDERSPSRDLRSGLGFAFDATLPPGASELFVRVDSIDSVALAPRIVPLADAGQLEGAAQHWLGLVHGFLLALVVTYGLLWLTLRETSLLRYVAYVASYLYMHLAYSGIAAHVAWPDSPPVGRFAILIGMTLFASAGISFAREFLRMANWSPRLDRTLAWLVRAALATMAVCVFTNAQGPAVDFAFAWIMSFTLLMVALGVLGVRHRQDQAKMFLVASLISMIGAMVATLAVMGKLPFNAFTFRAIEIGVMMEASIWALALGLRLRRDREGRVHALQLAQHDPLTALLNRRGFLDRALPALTDASAKATPLAVLMLDIDHFKPINDRYGHDAGDRTLVAVADRLRALARNDSLVARWGGEEFVILLPATAQAEALAIAERLRSNLADLVVALSDGREISLTVSLGVALSTESIGLEDLLRQADDALYKAKQAGRNRAEVWKLAEAGLAASVVGG